MFEIVFNFILLQHKKIARDCNHIYIGKISSRFNCNVHDFCPIIINEWHIYSALRISIWSLTVYPESRLGFSHTWGGWARVFTQIRFLQASYLQHDRRLPFLVGIPSLVDFVSASALTYHLRLTSAIGRIDSVIRHLVRITGSPPRSIFEIAVTEVRSDLAKSNTERFASYRRGDCRTTDLNYAQGSVDQTVNIVSVHTRSW